MHLHVNVSYFSCPVRTLSLACWLVSNVASASARSHGFTTKRTQRTLHVDVCTNFKPCGYYQITANRKASPQLVT